MMQKFTIEVEVDARVSLIHLSEANVFEIVYLALEGLEGISVKSVKEVEQT